MKIPTLTHVIATQRRHMVTAVTSLGDHVFVARWNNDEKIEIHDAVTLTLQRRLTVPGLGMCCWGLAACPNNNCVYASDNRRICVHRVELSGSNTAEKWSVASRPAGLSVNNEHNLIVACCDADRLQEYTTHGSLVREIDLRPRAGATSSPGSCKLSPFHAIQLSTGDYAVSRYRSPGVVSIVTAAGQVLSSYGQSQTSDVRRMLYPTSLAVTKNNILVVDAKKNRILSVNRVWGFIQELASGINCQFGLCLDESRGRLYVGKYDGEVLVFEVCFLLSFIFRPQQIIYCLFVAQTSQQNFYHCIIRLTEKYVYYSAELNRLNSATVQRLRLNFYCLILTRDVPICN